MRQHSSDLQNSLKVQINCRFGDSSVVHKLSISNVLKNFKETSLIKNSDDLEDYFLSKKLKVEMTPSKTQILSIIQAM
jgi:hypothetical protein